ncbi:MAG: glycosyltransferase family 2 protein, partial [Chthoniobacterales bacterium]|nr:glycosyltransferase family 2 protein [Chthoniobacterales bacterium]
MKLLIVIVNYKTPELTIDCLRSLDPEISAVVGGCSVVVTDNASGNGSPEKIAAAIAQNNWGSWVELMPLPRNGGFAYGNNEGIRAALNASNPPDYFYLLNPDTRVIAGALKALVEFLDAHPRAGVVGSRVENEDGSVRRSVFRFHTVRSEVEGCARIGAISKAFNRWIVAPPVPQTPERAEWVSGSSMVVRADVFKQIGLMDEGYFMYYEETDFCLRSHRAGWECWYVPQARIIHLVGQASGVTGTKRAIKRRPKYWFDSRARFFRQSYGTFTALIADFAWIGSYAIGNIW